MKKRKILVMLVAMIAALWMTALAEGHLSGSLDGRTLYVSWRVPEGSYELTVSQNDWPICLRNVTGGEGNISLKVDDPAAAYSLRLRNEMGCWTAKVSGKPAATEAPTAIPTAEPTKDPTAAPTAEPTKVPTAAPTAEPTKAPTTAPTAEPTKAPTAAPTVKPTKVPTTKPTAKPTVRPTSAPTQSVSVSNREDLANQVLKLVNEERAKQGLGALRMDAELTRAACVRGGELLQKFSHTRPDGSRWSTVSASAFAENIARGQRTAEKVMAAWMSSSEGHRENILRPSYGSIGICVFNHNGVMYWVQLFGR